MDVGRPRTLIGAVVLHLMIGVSGIVVGVAVPGVWLTLGRDGGVNPAPYVIGGGFVIYGLAAILGAVGVWRRSRQGWRLALAADAFGLAVLIAILAFLPGGDELIVSRIVIWTVAAALLLAPSTRRSIASR